MDSRDYTFLGLTRSLCPECRRLVDAKIITRGQRVYFRKHCSEHGDHLKLNFRGSVLHNCWSSEYGRSPGDVLAALGREPQARQGRRERT